MALRLYLPPPPPRRRIGLQGFVLMGMAALSFAASATGFVWVMTLIGRIFG